MLPEARYYFEDTPFIIIDSVPLSFPPSLLFIDSCVSSAPSPDLAGGGSFPHFPWLSSHGQHNLLHQVLAMSPLQIKTFSKDDRTFLGEVECWKLSQLCSSHNGGALFVMATFDELRKRTKQMSERVATMTGVKESLVLNIIMYAKNLAPTHHADVIDKVIFVAQLWYRFGITSIFHIDLIFESLKVKGSPHVKLEDYVRMICVFLTKDIAVKIDFVFRCYDIQRNGYLVTKEVHTLLKSSIIIGSDDHDSEDHVKELIELVMAMTDKNNDGIITFDEFKSYVKTDILCLELLGPVLPLEHFISSFVYLVIEKPPTDVDKLFARERQFCLQEPRIPSKRERLYPVRLEMP
ncbi:hypothetical protein RRG08_018278 [Elysia crispata]|uniref:EF-hand domain-containing protein n=1 Tax=Elysia crispata TaxID=231223 RepID=A0AAE1A0G7_9GAST|nr:hypothetical protein RRG08_018278 [Elysia crispata]